MKKTDIKRMEIAERLAGHLLSHGLAGSSLRGMARAAGTSDRMLLHYFADKQELMTATLSLVAERMRMVLETAPQGTLTFKELVEALAAMVNNPETRPFLRLWLELAASAAAGDEAHRDVANTLFRGYYAWALSRLKAEPANKRKQLAALAVSMVEGFMLLDVYGAADRIPLAIQGLDILNESTV